jgi:UDP-N-acetylglucosamine 2-epimerase (non-hydrolysing)
MCSWSTRASTTAGIGIRVAHVEAGLRSRDMSMPEEINRICTDAISDLLFTTDTLAVENLRHEGVADGKIWFVGNTMIDTLRQQIGRALERPLPDGLKPGEYAVLIRTVEPMSYVPFLGLVARSRMVLTDSGGIQEETTVLGVPCLTMRPNTERPITCEIGTNVLVGTDPRRIVDVLVNQAVTASCDVCV